MNTTTADHECRMALPFEAASARIARHRSSDALMAVGVAGCFANDAQLVVHELVTNGVEHGRPDQDGNLLVSWNVLDDLLLITVRDGGSRGAVAAQPPSADRAGGRGLAIIDAISETWTVARDNGTEVAVWLRVTS